MKVPFIFGLIREAAEKKYRDYKTNIPPIEEGNDEPFDVAYETGFNIKNRERHSAANTFKYIIQSLLGGEIFFFLFLTSGQFKTLIPLPSFLPGFLDLTLIFMLLTFCCAVYRTVRNGFKLPWAAGLRMLIPYLVILAAFVVSMMHPKSLSLNYGAVKLSDFVIKFGFSIAMPFFVLSSMKSVKRFLACLVIYTGIMALETIIRYFIMGIGRIGFVDVLGTSYMHASRFMCAGFITVLAIVIGRLRDNDTRFAFAYCICAMFAILVGGARASGLMFYAILFFPIILYIPYKKKRLWPGRWFRHYTVILGTLLIASLVIFATPLTNTFKYRMGVLPAQSSRAQGDIPLFQDGSGSGEVMDEEMLATLDNGVGFRMLSGPREYDGDLQEAIEYELNKYYGIKNSYIHPDWAALPTLLSSFGVYNQGYGVVQQVENWERHFYRSTLTKAQKKTLTNEGKNVEPLSRFDLLRYAINMIYKRPIQGWGLGSYPIYVFNYDARYYPHNMFLEVWAEGGLFAFLGLVTMILLAVWRILRAWFATRNMKDHWVYLAIAMTLAYWLTMTFLADFVNGCRILFVTISICMMAPYKVELPRITWNKVMTTASSLAPNLSWLKRSASFVKEQFTDPELIKKGSSPIAKTGANKRRKSRR